jgi:hypothetical protein
MKSSIQKILLTLVALILKDLLILAVIELFLLLLKKMKIFCTMFLVWSLILLAMLIFGIRIMPSNQDLLLLKDQITRRKKFVISMHLFIVNIKKNRRKKFR